jgi:hypothetical protein
VPSVRRYMKQPQLEEVGSQWCRAIQDLELRRHPSMCQMRCALLCSEAMGPREVNLGTQDIKKAQYVSHS